MVKSENSRLNLHGTTAMAMLMLFSAPVVAHAQGAAAPAAAPDDTVIVVTGVRASQQSSIDRKKKAKTATDSIVAEDVGVFPDKNIGEAISRIAGVALDRGGFNEGQEVSLRGVGSSQTNVELDGLGVQNTSISNNLSFGTGNAGRAKDFRDLPADLIKSVDVVKGSTAAMGEGGLGGSILIQTRNGLDFKKPYFSMSYNLSRNSLGQKITPTVNVIASRKFFNNKLGVIVNYSYGQTQNDSNQITQGGANNNQGLQAVVDFDNSPTKTFTFNPATVNGPASTILFANSSAIGSTTPGATAGTINPLQLVTASANAKTKADCYAAFPKLVGGNSAQNTQRSNELITCLNQWNDYTPSNIRYFVNRDTAQLTTVNVRLDYKLFNDLQVYFAVTDTHRKVDNNALSWTPGGFSINASNNGFSTGGNTWTDTQTTADPVYGVHRVGNASATGYYEYAGPSICPTITVATATAAVCNSLVVDNSVVNVINDSTLKVSGGHVVSATITDGNENTDNLHNTNDFHQTQIQFGGQYRHGPWAVDFVVGDALSHYTRYDQRINYSYTYGKALMTIGSSGLWSIKPAGSFNLADPTIYTVLKPPTGNINPKYIGCTFPNETAAQASIIGNCSTPTTASPGQIYNAAGPQPVPGTAVAVQGYTIAQQPWTSNSVTLQWQPKINDQETQVAKVDVTYNFSDNVPFFTDVKAGIQLKQDQQKGWANGGAIISPQQGILGFPNGSSCVPASSTSSTPSCLGALPYKAAVTIPTNNLRTTIRACDDTRYGTAGTAAPVGALSCNYGYVASTAAGAGPNTLPDTQNVLYGALTLRQSDFLAMVSSSLKPAWYRFFNGVEGRGDLFDGWPQIDAVEVYNRLSADATSHYNFDCVKRCLGSDGVLHYQPFSSFTEFSNAGYLMIEFEQDLPFGVRFNGNAGTRYIKTDTQANGFYSLQSRRCNNPADCTTSTADGQTTVYTITQSASYTGKTTDWTPSYNYNLWFWDDKIVARYYWGKVIARPPAGRLLPAGTCTLDQRRDATNADDTCSGFGNPNLKPFQAANENYSLEFYPNKDTQFSLAHFKNSVRVDNPVTCTKTGNLFAGTGIVDPFNGASLDNQQFTYSTFCDGGSLVRRGDEFAIKTAFTFLPWQLKYLGFDGNYGTVKSSQTTGGAVDPITGKTLPPGGEAGYYYNASMWYDDGSTIVRVAYQARDQVFNCLEPCGGTGAVRNTPNASPSYTNVSLPYSPGYPTFTEKTGYLDAKITHKWKGGVEGYMSIKNALSETVTTSQDKYGQLGDGTPVVLTYTYPGSRIDFGITVRR